MSMRAGGFGPETGYPQGFSGSQLPAIPKEQRKTWKLGSTANVSWVSVANHAGGYTYSLCPADQPLTEECFVSSPSPRPSLLRTSLLTPLLRTAQDKTPLQFVDSTSKLRYMFLQVDGTIGPNQTEVTIPAHRLTEGVLPAGSMWSKNPVPAGSWGGSWYGLPSKTHVGEWQGNQEPPQFEPPPGCDEHCWGYQPCNVGFTHPSYEGWRNTHAGLPNCSKASASAPLKNGEGCCHTTAYMAIVDEVRVPPVPPGEYVVRWRCASSICSLRLKSAAADWGVAEQGTASRARKSGRDAVTSSSQNEEDAAKKRDEATTSLSRRHRDARAKWIPVLRHTQALRSFPHTQLLAVHLVHPKYRGAGALARARRRHNVLRRRRQCLPGLENSVASSATTPHSGTVGPVQCLVMPSVFWNHM
jgi:hypothetical protein